MTAWMRKALEGWNLEGGEDVAMPGQEPGLVGAEK
jgi:hypothetical protein